jgi:hypothetical protein
MGTTPELDEETARSRRLLVLAHVTAALATGIFWFVLAVGYGLESWANSSCGPTTAKAVSTQHEAALAFGLLAGLAPVVVAVLFSRRHRPSAVVWGAIAVIVMVRALMVAPGVQPTQWCLY